MDCNFIKKRISAIIDNELNIKEKTLVDEHLKVCKECRELIYEYKKIHEKMLFLKEKEIEPEKIIQIQEQKKYSNSIFSLFNIKKLITASTVLVLVFIIFLSFVFITPVIYGNNETKKQIVNTLVNNYFKCVMKPSFGHQSFARFCNNSCEIIGKCCCGNVNKNCKRGGKQ